MRDPWFSSICRRRHMGASSPDTRHASGGSGMRACGIALLAAAASLQASFAHAQPALQGPMHILVGFAAGGSSDVAARLLAEKLKDTLGVAVIVDNKVGAGGRIAAEALKNAPADGSDVHAHAHRRAGARAAGVEAAQLRSGEGFRSRRAGRDVPVRPGGRTCESGQDRARVRRVGQGESFAGELRLARAGQPAAFFWPDGWQGNRHRAGPCCVQGRRAARHGPHGRPDSRGRGRAVGHDRAAPRRARYASSRPRVRSARRSSPTSPRSGSRAFRRSRAAAGSACTRPRKRRRRS